MSTITETLRAAVAAAATEHGSVNKLCQCAGVSQASVSAWLAGSQPNLSGTTIDKLGEYVGIETKLPKQKRKARTP